MPHVENITITLSFGNNEFLLQLFGQNSENLIHIEENVGVDISSRGEMVSVYGAPNKVKIAEETLRRLYRMLKRGEEINNMEIDATIHMMSDKVADNEPVIPGEHDKSIINAQRKVIKPLSRIQASYIDDLKNKDVVFAAGPAGTGKTYIAVAAAVEAFSNGDVERIILSRPAVEAGEKLGFLPGDMREKVDPYLRPIYDALYDMFSPEKVIRYLETGQVEIAPLAFMRGRTLRNAYVILDEAQNCTAVQMKMFLTRLGEGSRMVVTGDLSQVDLPNGTTSGFNGAMEILKNIKEVGITRLGQEDVVRHSVTAKIVQAYESAENL